MHSHEMVTQLFDEHVQELYRYVRFSVGDPTDAEDIVQEVFLRVVRSWDSFRQDSNPKTWIWVIARRCITDYIRTKKRRARNLGLETIHTTTSVVLDSLVELEDSLRVLPVKQRQVFILRMVQDMSTQEAAQVLGCSQTMVKVLLHKAVKTLRNELGSQELTRNSTGKEGENRVRTI